VRGTPTPLGAVLAVGYSLGAVAMSLGLPQQIPPSVGVPGHGNVWLGGPMVAFLLPTAMLITDAALRGLCLRYPVDPEGASDVLSVYDAVMLRTTTFVIGVHATVLAGLLGMFWGRGWAAQIVPLMLGVGMVSVGNLLPRTRPNLAIGIRTARTLSSRSHWVATHRTAGYTLVGLGAAVIVGALAVPAPFGPALILLVAPAAVVGISLLLVRSRFRAHA